MTPVTLWRGDHYEGDSFFLSESKHQRREEWKALPVDAYAALVAENARLREALAQIVPDWLPVSSAEAKWAVRECADEIMVRLFRARTALGAERA